MTKLPKSLEAEMNELTKQHMGTFRCPIEDDDLVEAIETAFTAGAAAMKLRADKLILKSLQDWIVWEREQVVKHGPYVGKQINELINQAEIALAEYRALFAEEKS